MLKISITFFESEYGLEAVYARLASMADERTRARALRATLPVLYEFKKLPSWFHQMPSLEGTLPRVMTIRIALPENDPSFAGLASELHPASVQQRIAKLKSWLAHASAANPIQEVGLPSAQRIKPATKVEPTTNAQSSLQHSESHEEDASKNDARLIRNKSKNLSAISSLNAQISS